MRSGVLLQELLGFGGEARLARGCCQITGGPGMGEGFLQFVLADEGKGQMIMRPGRVRVEPQRFGELVGCLARAVEFQERKSQIVVRLWVSRVEARGGGKVSRAFFQLALPHQCYSEITVSLPIIRFEAQCFKEARDGMVQLGLQE